MRTRKAPLHHSFHLSVDVIITRYRPTSKPLFSGLFSTSELSLNAWRHITQELVMSRVQNLRQRGNLNLPITMNFGLLMKDEQSTLFCRSTVVMSVRHCLHWHRFSLDWTIRCSQQNLPTHPIRCLRSGSVYSPRNHTIQELQGYE